MQKFIQKFFWFGVLVFSIFATTSPALAYNPTREAVPPDGSDVIANQTITYTTTIDDIDTEVFNVSNVIDTSLTTFDDTKLKLWVTVGGVETDERTDWLYDQNPPDAIDFCSALDSSGFTCSFPVCAGGNPIPCITQPDEIKLEFPVTVNTGVTGDIVNTTTVKVDGQPDKNLTITHPIVDTLYPFEKTADLSTPSPILSGGNIGYDFIIKNNSTVDIPIGTVITDTIDSNLEIMAIPSTCKQLLPPDEQTIECTTTSVIPAGSSLSFDVETKHRGINKDQVSNQASFDLNGDTYTSNEVLHDIQDEIVIKTADPVAQSFIAPNESIEYDIKITNTTATEMKGIITDMVSDYLIIDETTLPDTNNGDPVTCTTAGQKITCTELTIAAGADPVTLSFTTVVDKNIDPTITEQCNTAELYIDQNTTYSSEEICHNIEADPWTFTKKASPAGGDYVANGSWITYTVDISTDEATSGELLTFTDTVSDKVTIRPNEITGCDNLLITNQEVKCTFTPTDASFSATIEIQVEVDIDAVGNIENTAVLEYTDRPTKPTIETNTITHYINSKTPINITKTSDVPESTMLTSGTKVTYTVEIENTEGTTLNDVVVNDTLSDDFFKILRVEPLANCGQTSPVLCNFDSLTGNEKQTITIEAEVIGSETESGAFCNTAVVDYSVIVMEDNEPLDSPVTTESNSICNETNISIPEIMVRSGGSAEVHPTVGTCATRTLANGNENWQCVPRYPKAKTAGHNDPFYDVYTSCRRDKKTEAECLTEWVEASGFTLCGQTDPGYDGFEDYDNFNTYLGYKPVIKVPYGSGDADTIFTNFNGSGNEILAEQCNAGQVVDLTDDDNNSETEVDPNTSVNVCNTGTDPNAPVLNMTITKTIDKKTVSRGDKVFYTITATPEVITENNVKITSAKLTVYDYTVPSESGKTWYRNGIIEDGKLKESYDGWALSGAVASGIQFTKDITASLNDSYVIKYPMDTELAIDQDISQLKNVAFGRLTVQYTVTTKNENDEPIETSASSVQFFNQEGTALCAGNDNKSFDMALDTTSNGATTTLNIIRPFLGVIGGGNVGGLQPSYEGEEKLFGDVKEIETTLKQNITTASVTEQDNLITPTPSETLSKIPQINSDQLEQYKKNVSKSYSEGFFKTLDMEGNVVDTKVDFSTTPDKSGIYFGDGPVILDLDGEFDAGGQSKTFVIENGPLIIKNNFTVTNGYVAFILRNGNMIVHNNVTKIEGIFMVEPIRTEEDAITEEVITIGGVIISSPDAATYESPLQISGGLIGDAKTLIGNRRYVGTDGDLKPSMTILFDIRLLDETPPGLEDFLGGDWEQSVK